MGLSRVELGTWIENECAALRAEHAAEREANRVAAKRENEAAENAKKAAEREKEAVEREKEMLELRLRLQEGARIAVVANAELSVMPSSSSKSSKTAPFVRRAA